MNNHGRTEGIINRKEHQLRTTISMKSFAYIIDEKSKSFAVRGKKTKILWWSYAVLVFSKVPFYFLCNYNHNY